MTSRNWVTLDLAIAVIAYIISFVLESMSDCTGNSPFVIGAFVALVISGFTIFHAAFIFAEFQTKFAKKNHIGAILALITACVILIVVAFSPCNMKENIGTIGGMVLIFASGIPIVALHMKYGKK